MDFGDMCWEADPVADGIIDKLFTTMPTLPKQKKKKKKKVTESVADATNQVLGPVTMAATETEISGKELRKQNKNKNKYAHLSLNASSEITQLRKNVPDDKLCEEQSGTVPGEVKKDSKRQMRMKLKKQKLATKLLNEAVSGNVEIETPNEVAETVETDKKKKRKKIIGVKSNGATEKIATRTITKKSKLERKVKEKYSDSDTFEEEPFRERDNTQNPTTEKISAATITKKSKKTKSKRKVQEEDPDSDTFEEEPLRKKNKQNPQSRQSTNFDLAKLQNVLSRSNRKNSSSKSRDEDSGSEDSGSEDVSPQKKKVEEKPKNLKERMQEQLSAARFRYLNEQMYTSTGEEAYQLFSDDRASFSVYHSGFQTQVEKWPENPLDRMIDYVKRRPAREVICDLGCGEARLAASVPHTVHSFDLVAANDSVTACNMQNLPCETSSVDVAVFCLSLMGTSLVEYLLEAHRVLKHSGTLLIAEVTSRFEKIGAFVRKLSKMGFILLEKDTSNKMFVWFEFRKLGEVDTNTTHQMDLLPCIYKKR